jgi:cytochrome bd-type quinol oxidase subunit 2
MMKNIKEIVILALTSGILILLAVIIIGDYWVAVKENRTVDTEIITLMKMSITGLIGIMLGSCCLLIWLLFDSVKHQTPNK